MPRRSLRLVHALLVALGLTTAAGADQPVTVFGAASLGDALEEAGALALEEIGEAVRFSFASSSTLARQIEAGAGADVYVSASQEWMNYLEARGLVEPETRTTPIGNRIVLVAPALDAPEAVEIGPDLDLGALLGEDGRLALGDVEHVPAGIYARQALTTLGLWDQVSDRLALADDVRAALALVDRGEAPLGIVYATDARVTEGVEVVGTFPESSHAPITYPFAVVAGRDRPEVRRVFELLTGPAARQVYQRAGFTLR